MAIDSVEDALQTVDEVLCSKSLTNLQEVVIRYAWEGKTYTQIAEATGYDDDYIRDVGFQLWRTLSQAFGKKVSKNNFKSVLRCYQDTPQPKNNRNPAPLPELLPLSTQLVDWGMAADIPHFYGRDRELTTLSHWILGNSPPSPQPCRLISILGLGGIGKSALATRLAQTLAPEFDSVLWRSLKAAPPLTDLLDTLLNALTPVPAAPLPIALSDKLDAFLQTLRQKRGLVILDNLDALLEPAQPCGTFQPNHQDYCEFIRQLGEVEHRSCILITSREKPQNIDDLEGEHFPVRTLYLGGLDAIAAQHVLHQTGLIGEAPTLTPLINFYGGHPLALKIVSTTIRELFGGNIDQFLHQGYGIFNGLHRLLQQQLQRLSDLETAVLYWLAINQDPVPLSQLQTDLIQTPLPGHLLAVLDSLKRRSLLETVIPPSIAGFVSRNEITYTLQPAVMESFLHDLIQKLCHEITTQTPQLFCQYALIKATADERIRDSQTRLILAPMVSQLLSEFGTTERLAQHLQSLLRHLQTLPRHQIGYGGGNLINLFRHLQTDLTGSDFSKLPLRQALLHDLNLQQTNFSYTTFTQCTFANTFGSIIQIAFSPEGETFATCDSNGSVTLWSTQTRHPIAQCQGHDHWTWGVAFHPTQPLLVSCGQDRTVRIWSTETGYCLKVLQGHIGMVHDVAFSPQGDAVISCSNDGIIKQWDFQTGDCLQTLKAHEKGVWSVAFTADGQHLFSGGEDHDIRYWDLATGNCLKVFSGHGQWVMAIALSADGRLLASGSKDGMVKLWCPVTGNCLQTLVGHGESVTGVAFSPDGRTLASSSYDQSIRLWDTRTGTCTHRLNKHSNRVWTVKFHPNGWLLASGGDDNTTRFWDLQTGEVSTTLQGYSNGVDKIALHPHRPLLASGHEDQTIRLWSLSSLLLEESPGAGGTSPRSIIPSQVLRGHNNRIKAIAFSPDGTALASGSFDRTIKLWDLQTLNCLRTLNHNSWVWDVTFHPQGQLLASASYDQTVKLWDAQTGHCTHTLEGHQGSALCVDFSPQGQLLVSGGYEQLIKLWDVASGDCLRTWKAHLNRVWQVAFSPNGQWIATAGEDHQIILWETETGDRLQTFSGHQQQVLDIQFSNDGNFLISSSVDRTIKQWDVKTGQCLQTLLGHRNWILSVAQLTPALLLTGSHDETIQCWNLASGQSIQQMEVPRPYAEMNIIGAQGLSAAQHQVLKVLGAVSAADAS
jgi:WD40 repeat protein